MRASLVSSGAFSRGYLRLGWLTLDHRVPSVHTKDVPGNPKARPGNPRGMCNGSDPQSQQNHKERQAGLRTRSVEKRDCLEQIEAIMERGKVTIAQLRVFAKTCK
jgi:hypothetical protein